MMAKSEQIDEPVPLVYSRAYSISLNWLNERQSERVVVSSSGLVFYTRAGWCDPRHLSRLVLLPGTVDKMDGVRWCYNRSEL